MTWWSIFGGRRQPRALRRHRRPAVDRTPPTIAGVPPDLTVLDPVWTQAPVPDSEIIRPLDAALAAAPARPATAVFQASGDDPAEPRA